MNPLAIAAKSALYAQAIVAHQLTDEVTEIACLCKVKGNFYNVTAQAAAGLLTFSANPDHGDTVTIGTRVYTFKSALTGAADEVLIGADLPASIAALVAALAGASQGKGTLYTAATAAHAAVLARQPADNVLRVQAQLPGTAGNAIASLTTAAAAAWGAATLTDGDEGKRFDISDGWLFGPVRPRDTVMQGTAQAAYFRGFQLAADLLTPEQARLVCAIERGEQNYMVEFHAAPEGFDQSFAFRVLPLTR